MYSREIFLSAGAIMLLSMIPPAVMVKEPVPVDEHKANESLLGQIIASFRQSIAGYRNVSQDHRFLGLILHWFFSWSSWYIVLPTITSFIPEVIYKASPGKAYVPFA